MEISRKTDYALRMLCELVKKPDCIVSVREASEDCYVPYSFARAIQHDLTCSGIIESVRGAHGGMRLAVDPAKTTLLEIIEATQGSICFSECESIGSDSGKCPRFEQCNLGPVWDNATSIMRGYFGSITLADVAVAGLVPEIDASFSLVPSGR